MFLNLLNNEEKRIFLKLAIAVVQADGKLEESEKQYIAEYAREAGLSDYDLDTKFEPLPLAKKIGSDSAESVKRIFLLELTACAKADGNFAETEKSLINSFVKAFGLSDESLQKCNQLIEEYTKISAKLISFIEEGK